MELAALLNQWCCKRVRLPRFQDGEFKCNDPGQW